MGRGRASTVAALKANRDCTRATADIDPCGNLARFLEALSILRSPRPPTPLFVSKRSRAYTSKLIWLPATGSTFLATLPHRP
jgi:hypothetical protein